MNPLIRRIQNKVPKESFIYIIAKKIYMLPRLWFTKYGYLYNYLILPIIGLLREYHIKPFYDSNSKLLESLKGKHKGKRCFIIATGPSLRIDDVEMLKDEITIGVNSLYRLFDKTDFRPTYYTVLDPDGQRNVEEHLNDYSSFCTEHMFFNPIRKSKNKKINYISICYQNHWYNVFTPGFDYLKNLKYTSNVMKYIYDKYTITNAAIELAIYMGCKEIYLLGVDCNYTGPKIYFDDLKKATHEEREKGYYTQKAMMAGYKFMEYETRKRGVHIFNATRGGLLEEFDRVDFDSLFEKSVK